MKFILLVSLIFLFLDGINGQMPSPDLFGMDSTKVLIPYRKGVKWGYCNLKKEIVIKPVFDYAEPFGYTMKLRYFTETYTTHAKVNIGSKAFILNKYGEKLLESSFIAAEQKKLQNKNLIGPSTFENAIAGEVRNNIESIIDNNFVVIKSKCVLNIHGDTIIKKGLYDKIELLNPSQGYFIVTKNKRKGIVDASNNILIEVENLFWDETYMNAVPKYLFYKKEKTDDWFLLLLNDYTGGTNNYSYIKKYKKIGNYLAIQQMDAKGYLFWTVWDYDDIFKGRFFLNVDDIKSYFTKYVDFFLISKKVNEKTVIGYMDKNGTEYFEE